MVAHGWHKLGKNGMCHPFPIRDADFPKTKTLKLILEAADRASEHPAIVAHAGTVIAGYSIMLDPFRHEVQAPGVATVHGTRPIVAHSYFSSMSPQRVNFLFRLFNEIHEFLNIREIQVGSLSCLLGLN